MGQSLTGRGWSQKLLCAIVGMGPAGEKAKCTSRRQSASPVQKSPSTASPERTTNTTSNKQNPPDIVISASPRFTRKKDFKAAGRIRSKDKNTKKKPVSMENTDMPQEAITQSDDNEDIESLQESDGHQIESSEPLSLPPTEFTVTEVVRETLDEDGICVSSTTHIETMSTDGQTISTVMQESRLSNLDSQTIIGSDEGQSTQLQEVDTKEEREEVVEPEFVVREAYTVGSQEEIAQVTSTHQAQECLVVETSDSQSQFEEFQQLETKQSYEELKGEGAPSCDESEQHVQENTIEDTLTNVEFTSQQENAVISEKMSNHVNQVSMYSSVESSSIINEQEVELKSDYTCSENIESSSRKPSSLALDKNGDGSSFWTHSARNSVISSPSRDGLTDSLGSPTESVRDILIQKRVSLTHTPDIVRVFDKDFQQASRDMHEFQKVKNELKRVEEQAASMRRISQASDHSKTQNSVTESFESTTSCLVQEEEAEALHALDTVVTEAANKVKSRSISQNMIVDLIPGPVVNIQRKSVKEEDKKVSKQVSKSGTSAVETKKKNSDEKKAANKMVEQKNARNTQISQSGGTTVKKNAVKKEKSKTTMIATQSSQMTSEKSQQSVKSLDQINQSGSTTSVSDNSSSVQKKSNARQTKSAGKESDDIKRNKSNEKRSVSKSGPNDKKGLLQSPNLIKQVKGPTSDKNTNKKQVASSNGSLESPGLLRDINGGSNKSITGRTGSPSRKTPCSDSKSTSPVPTIVRSLSPEGKPPTAGTRSPSVSERTMSPERKSLHTRSPSVVSGRSMSPAGKSPSRNGSSVNGLDKDDTKIKSTSKSSLSSGRSGSLKRQNSKVREKTIKKEDMLFDKNKNGENKENGFAKRDPPKTTASTAKGGYLAPTKSWIRYMGDPIDLKSRSPSPAPPERKRSTTVPRKITDRSPSPRRRLRESSTESESKEKSRKPAVCPPPRKMMEKDPNLPTVKRSASMRSKAQTNGDLKRTDSMKKTITNGIDKDLAGTKTPQETGVAKSETQPSEKQNTSSIRKKQKDVSSNSVTRKAASNKSENKNQININSAETATKTRSTSGPKKVPPPVAPKPICASNISPEYQVSDSNLVNRSEDSALTSTAAITQNQLTSEEIATNNTVQVFSSLESSSTASAHQVETKSETNQGIQETSTHIENSCKTIQSEVCEESGIEETSISATQAIQKFETQSKSLSVSTDASCLSNLMQETVSSRMKKVSGEEFALDRKSSLAKTGEAISEEQETIAQEESQKVSESTAENNKIVKSIARAKSFSAKKSSTTDSSVTAKKTSVLVSSSTAATDSSTSVSNGVSISTMGQSISKVSLTGQSTASASSTSKKSSAVSTSNTTSSKKSSVSSAESSNTTEVSKSLTSSSKAKSSVVAASATISSSTIEESVSQSSKVNSSTEKRSTSAKTSEKSSSQSTSAVSTSSVRSSSLQRSESKGLKQVTAKKNAKSQETNGSSGPDSAQLKTTMVVRLHPGQSRRLSAYMDQQDQKGEELNTRTWLGDVQYQDNPASICGLEISFSSVPQDIDIKLIPGNSNCAIDNQESGQAAKAEASPHATASDEPLATEPDQNKTRQ